MSQESINWNRFDDRYVRLVPDIEKKLKLSNWRDGTWFGKPGLSFNVDQEDGEKVTKVFTTVSRKLVAALKPILMTANRNGKSSVTVRIMRLGEGFETRYVVNNNSTSLRDILK